LQDLGVDGRIVLRYVSDKEITFEDRLDSFGSRLVVGLYSLNTHISLFLV